MDIRILGAGGSFGRAASEAFAAAGHAVSTIDRLSVDIYDRDALRTAFEGADVVVNALNPPYGDWAHTVPRFTAAIAWGAREAGTSVLLPGNVYNYGPDLPERLGTDAPHRGGSPKGDIRIELERTYRDAGTRTVLLRCGDFIDVRPSDNWLDTYILDAKKARFTYPGPMDRVHAWAFLPDAARAAVALCELTDRPDFLNVPFPGWSLTGAELHAACEAAAGTTLRRKSFPWWFLRLAAPFFADMREVLAMRYLWNRPHAIAADTFDALLPGFEHTAPTDGLRRLWRAGSAASA